MTYEEKGCAVSMLMYARRAVTVSQGASAATVMSSTPETRARDHFFRAAWGFLLSHLRQM